MSSLPPTAALLSRPETISDIVYNAIRDAIVQRRLAPGERVTEAGLAKWLNVSKTPVREAMLRLQEVGLLEADGIRGSRVVQPSELELANAFDVREALEVFAAERAAEELSEGDREQLAKLADESVAVAGSGDYRSFREIDRRFHRILAQGNPRLQKVLQDVGDFLQVVRERDVPRTDDVRSSAESHRAIAKAVAARDVDAAGDAMRMHIRAVRRYYSDRAE